MEDEYILTKIQNKDELHYQELINKYMRYVGAIVVKISGDRLTNEDIEEICSDIFIKIWDNSKNIVLQNGSLKTYIGVITRNHTINILKKNNKYLESAFEDAIIKYESTEETVIGKEETKALKKVINSMQEPDREIFIRRYFYSEKIRDIANKKGMNEKTVSTKLSRTRLKLQSILVKEEKNNEKY